MSELPQPLQPLLDYRQFILYKLVPKVNGKTDKLPFDAEKNTVVNAHDPSIWKTYDEVKVVADLYGQGWGVGFVFTEHDPFWFIDIDNCRQPDGSWSPVAKDLCNRLPGAAVEISQSGKGLHIFGMYHGAAPPHSCKNVALGLEMYTEKRFVALTGTGAYGNVLVDCASLLLGVIEKYFPPDASYGGDEIVEGWRDYPVQEWNGPHDDEELIQKMLSSTGSAASIFSSKASFKDLWTNNAVALSQAYPSQNDNDPYDRSSADMALAQHLAFWTGKNHERIRCLMWISALVRDKWTENASYMGRTISKAVSRQSTVYGYDTEGPVNEANVIQVADTKNVEEVALAIANQQWLLDLYPINWQGVTYIYEGGGYIPMEKGWVEKQVTLILPKVYGMGRFANATKNAVSNVTGYLNSLWNVPFKPGLSQPFWRENDGSQPDPAQLVLFYNGILNLADRSFMESTPHLFSTQQLPHDYDPEAGVPARWHQFLEEVWPGDVNSQLLLGEIMGYLLAGGTEMQKIFAFIGVRRGGKGTVGRVINSIIGQHNIVSSSLKGASTDFGLQSMIDKKVWIIADARVGTKLDHSVVVERLLNISGEDSVTIARKHVGDWIGTLSVRAVIMANVMPNLYDPSGAMLARLVPLKFTTSFEGREDVDLDNKLQAELSGIINSALDGLSRLRAQGKFTETDATQEMRDDFQELADPMHGFVGEVIVENPGGEVDVYALYATWMLYRAQEGISVAGSKATFGKLLKERLPSVKKVRRGQRSDRSHCYLGISLVTGALSGMPILNDDQSPMASMFEDTSKLS